MATIKIRKSTWNTYSITGYSYQAGTDSRATGGVQLHQVRLHRGQWQKRTVDSNGRFQSAGELVNLTFLDGETYFERAKNS